MELLERLDKQEIHGEPDGSPPIRVSAEEGGFRFGRLIVDAVFRPMNAQNVWILHVMPRKRAYSMRREEFVFIQHVTECMAQFVRIDDGEESPFAIPWGTHTRDVGCQVAPVVDKPLEPTFEIGKPLQKFGLQGLNSKERNQTDHGTDLHRCAFTVWEMEYVIEEAVLFIPHGFFTVAAVAHGIGDVEEVFPELAGDVFVDGILAGEFEG